MSSALKKTDSTTDPLAYFSSVVTEITGVQLGQKQRSMVEARLSKRIRDLALSNWDQYLSYFNDHRESELPEIISLLTTHHTYFFREFTQFEFLESKFLDKLIAKARTRPDKKIKIWSAACSRGQEVYSLAMFIKFHLALRAPDVSFSILGTDIDSHSVAIAQNGVYARKETNEIPLSYLGNHWLKGTEDIVDFVKAKPSLKDLCTFEAANLIDLPARLKDAKFDIIFCRNVFIYFTMDQVKKITESLLSKLDPDGFLFIGISESLNGLGLPIETLGPSIYTHQGKAPTVSKGPQILSKKSGTPSSKPASPSVAAVTASPAPKAIPAVLRVMVVDDSPSIHALMKQILTKEEGFEIVAQAKSGIEAAKLLKENKIDIITLDIHMPEQTGVEYLERNYSSSHPPVVMVTSVSRDDGNLAFKALSLGASDYVEKPALQNLAERSDEIRTKLRVSYQSYKLKDSHKLDLDKSFKRLPTIPHPENKVRVVIANLADRDRMLFMLKEFEGHQPPTFILVEGSDAALPDMAKHLSTKSRKTIEYLPQPNGKEKLGGVYLCDFKSCFGDLLALYKGKKTSISVFGDVSKSATEKVLNWTNAQLLLEDLGNKKGAKHLMEIATDVTPATSFAYLSNEYFGKD